LSFISSTASFAAVISRLFSLIIMIAPVYLAGS
jgi:hypothetical protein